MKRAVVLKHIEFEGPGAIAPLVTERGYRLDVRSLHRGDGVPRDVGRDELLIVMGGPMGVGDLERPEYPYLRAELELLERRVLEDAPVLGVCLGAQLLARAAGGAVYPMRTEDGGRRIYEVGWAPVRFHPSEGDGVLAGMPGEAPMLHWHGDTFDLPAGVRPLASSALCPNQGFRLGRRLFGLQFHCETSAQDVDTFLVADAAFVVEAHGGEAHGGEAHGGEAHGGDIFERLRRETARHIDSSRTAGDRLLRNILDAMISSGEAGSGEPAAPAAVPAGQGRTT
jgi:GMP synthase (glutamine-hydrolysing)